MEMIISIPFRSHCEYRHVPAHKSFLASLLKKAAY